MSESSPFLGPEYEARSAYDESEKSLSRQKDASRCSRHWKNITLLLLSVANVCLVVLLFRPSTAGFLGPGSGSSNRFRPKDTLVDSAVNEIQLSQVRFISDYSAGSVSEMDRVDDSWSAITPTLGTVAVDQVWAMEHGLPEGEILESDTSKGVYVLEAYHSLHCLTVIRRTLFQLARGEKLDIPFGHSTHCLAGILQSVVCNADDTLLYYRRNSSVGDGQRRVCRNWGALRTWASKNTACYVTNNMAVQYENSSSCLTTDGLKLESSFS